MSVDLRERLDVSSARPSIVHRGAWRAGEDAPRYRARRARAGAARERDVQDLVPGSVIEGPLGACFVAERDSTLDHRHGDEALGRFFDLTDRGLGCLARSVEPLAIDRESIVFLDTETTGLAGGTGTYVFMVGLAYFRGDRLLVRQYFMRDHAEEPAMLAALEPGAWPPRGRRHVQRQVVRRAAAADPLHRQPPAPARPDRDPPGPAAPVPALLAGAARVVHAGDAGAGGARAQPRRRRPVLDDPGAVLPLPARRRSSRDGGRLRAQPARRAEPGGADLSAGPPARRPARPRSHLAPDGSTRPERLRAVRGGSDLRGSRAAGGGVRPLRAGARGEARRRVRARVASRLAALCKRAGRHERAVQLWRRLATLGLTGCEPFVELAKHFEHRLRDYDAAIEVVEEALTVAESGCCAAGRAPPPSAPPWSTGWPACWRSAADYRMRHRRVDSSYRLPGEGLLARTRSGVRIGTT